MKTPSLASLPSVRNSGRRSLLLLLAPVALLVVTGCQVLTYSSPSGEKFTRSSFGSRTAIASLTVESGTNGVRRLSLHGYRNDSTQALGVITESAVRAAVESVKP